MARSNEPGMPKAKTKTSGAEGVKSKYRKAEDDNPVSWELSEATLLHDAICFITDVGDAVLVAKSRDGSVLCLTVFSGETREKFFWRDPIEIHAGLTKLIEAARTA